MLSIKNNSNFHIDGPKAKRLPLLPYLSLLKGGNTEIQTGLPNAHGYLREVDRIIKRRDITKYNAFYFDIVNMTRINSTYGKETGDEIIRVYAHNIQQNIKFGEVLGRLGGNYFVALILKENTPKFLEYIKSVPVSFSYHNHTETIYVAAVVGGYRIETKKINASKIMGKISLAISYAKNIAHRDCVFIDDKLEEQIRKQKELEYNTRNAVFSKEYVPYYQPKIDTVTKQICGCEALVRWKTNAGIMSPDHFIPVMEQTNSICLLDFYMLEMVCQDMRDWIDRGINPPRVSINFSRKNLENPTLADDIYNTITKFDIPVSLIQIEITETLDEYPISLLMSVVRDLQEKGITTAIDDFGTGSSSIILLKEVPFDVLKIDKTFIDFSDEKEKLLLIYIIQMAKAIGISVIAEGVEREDQIADLLEMGCTTVQGFVFDEPLDKITYETRLATQYA